MKMLQYLTEKYTDENFTIEDIIKNIENSNYYKRKKITYVLQKFKES